jgi:pyruvate formate lyase activating enzyme
VFFDYAFDTAVLANGRGIKNVFVTNGYLSKESFIAIQPYLDAANIDLKTFQDRSYRSLCGARLQPVLDTIERMAASGIWMEVTTLLIPGINDSEKEIRQIASYIKNIDPGIPWHVSRFHPAYKMLDTNATPIETLRTAYQIGRDEGLKYVYVGNMPGEMGESTFCHGCGARLITRWGFQVTANRIIDDQCPECNRSVQGQW